MVAFIFKTPLVALLACATSTVLAIEYAVFPGWDMDNGSLNLVNNISEIDCGRLCNTITGCLAYAYAPYGLSNSAGMGLCVPKASITLNTFQPSTQSGQVVNTGVQGNCTGFTSVPAPICFSISVV